MKRTIIRATALTDQEQGTIARFQDILFGDPITNLDGTFRYRSDNREVEKLPMGDLIPVSAGEYDKNPEDWKSRVESSDFFLWNLATYGDYTGSTVTIANFRSLLAIADSEAEKLGKNRRELGVFETYGGFSSAGIAIRINCPLKAVWRAIQGCIDYPLINEDELSDVEIEAQDSNWESWAKYDFTALLTEEYPLYDVEAVSDSDVYTLFRKGLEASNGEWINEIGDSMTVDMARVFTGIEELDIMRLGGVVYHGEPDDQPVDYTSEEAAGQQVLTLAA